MMLFSLCVLVKKMKNALNIDNILILGVGINLLLTLLTIIFLPGASYLFAMITLFGSIALAPNYIKNNMIKHILFIVSYGFLLLLILPSLWSFYHALTIGGISILILLMIINATVTIPIIFKHFNLQ